MKRANVIIILSLSLVALSIALMWLPTGVAMRFTSDPGPPMEYVTHYCPYISGLPIGYGNWFPIITAMISFTVLFMLIPNVARKTVCEGGSKTALLVCLSICIIASFVSWGLFGSVSVTGVIICTLHCAVFALQFVHTEKIAENPD